MEEDLHSQKTMGLALLPAKERKFTHYQEHFFANRDQKSSILNQIIAPPESLQTIVFQGWTSLQESHLHLWLLTSDFISGSGALLRSHLSED